MAALQHPDNTVQRVKESADIVEIIGEVVALKRSGANLKGNCPFHSEKTPSFMVNPERRSFHCFGCGEGGDVFSFVMKYHNLTFPEALKDLAHRYHITLPEKDLSPQEIAGLKKREALYSVNDKAADLYHQFLLHNKAAEPARNYLRERAIPQESISDFRLGFAPESWDFFRNNIARLGFDQETAMQAGLLAKKTGGGYYDRFRSRILFPIVDSRGKTVGFGGRILGNGQPKYLNTPETTIFDKGSTLFGLFQNRDHIKNERQCIIVEGNFDLLTLVGAGLKNVVAPLGTALTKAHVRSLKGYAEQIVLLFDGDEAGIKAAMRSMPIFISEQVSGSVVILPEKHDPDTFIRAHGVAALQNLIKNALSLPEFIFDRLAQQYGLSIEGKSRIVNELKPIIDAIEDSAQRSLFAAHFGSKLGLSPEQLFLAKPKPASGAWQSTPTAKKRPAAGVIPPRQRQLLEFVLIYPEYLEEFLDAGLEEIIESPSALALLSQIKHFVVNNPGIEPEDILTHVNNGEKALLSSLLVSAPFYSDDEKKMKASQQVEVLRTISLKNRIKKITMQISEAQQSRNDSLYMELMAKKREMVKQLAS